MILDTFCDFNHAKMFESPFAMEIYWLNPSFQNKVAIDSYGF